MGLQPISFNHSDIPPRGVAAAILERRRESVRCTREWGAGFDFEPRVLRPAEEDRGAAFEFARRDEPAAAISYVNEQVIEPRWIEPLHDTTPTPVAAPCAERHLP